jgi:hypothetical protein
MTVTTNLNDRWSRVAALASEKPEPKPVKLVAPTAPIKKEPALEIAGLTTDDAKRLIAKFSNKPVIPSDKHGVSATQNGNVLSIWLDVTPNMAERWLKSNFNNRPVKEDVVTAYARDMANDVWQPTHQGIAFNDRDELIDGQHRLRAIIKCGKTIRMMVTFGLASKINGKEMTTMDCVDRGCARSVGDQLKIQHGIKAASHIAGVCSAIAHLCMGERLRRLSVQQTLEIYRAFQTGVDYVVANRSKESGLKSAAVLAAFAFVFGVDEKQAKHRLAVLNTGEEIQRHPQIAALREFLISNESIVMLKRSHRGVVELVTHTLWLDLQGATAAEIEKNPDEWLKSVVLLRQAQRTQVENIARLFQLPEAA